MRRKNFQVDIAQNGKIALDMFRSNPDLYKLILMVRSLCPYSRGCVGDARGRVTSHNAHISPHAQDIHMPVMDGVTCTRHIREYENAQNIQNKVPIIALTGTRRTHSATFLRNREGFRG